MPNLNASLLGGNAASAFALASGSPNYIQNGTEQQAASFNIGGNGSANSFNSATGYQIGGSTVLYTGSPALNSLFVGLGAGGLSSGGNQNTFVGPLAGNSNTAGGGDSFFGYAAGSSNTVGGSNSFFWNSRQETPIPAAPLTHSLGCNRDLRAVLARTIRSSEMWPGIPTPQVGRTFPSVQTPVGLDSTNVGQNVFVGVSAGFHNTTGGGNTMVGFTAGLSNTTGANNVFYGYNAGGFNNTGSNNVYIAAPGVGAENNTIRIGSQGSGQHQQNVTYIAGISGASTSGDVPVFIDATGKLGTTGGSLGGVTSFKAAPDGAPGGQ